MRLNSLILASSCIVILTACTASPTNKYTPIPQLTFAHLLEIPVQIRDIDFTVDTHRGAQPWDISNELPTPPDVAMRRYIEQRYKAVGADGVLTINLKKADIHFKEIPQNNFLMKHVSFVNQHEYTFEIIVKMAAKYLSGNPDRETSLRFVRKEVIAPHVTPAYREARLQRVLEEIIRDIDEAMIREFAHEFYIIRERNIPIQAIDIKSKEPEMETIYSQKMVTPSREVIVEPLKD